MSKGEWFSLPEALVHVVEALSTPAASYPATALDTNRFVVATGNTLNLFNSRLELVSSHQTNDFVALLSGDAGGNFYCLSSICQVSYWSTTGDSLQCRHTFFLPYAGSTYAICALSPRVFVSAGEGRHIRFHEYDGGATPLLKTVVLQEPKLPRTHITSVLRLTNTRFIAGSYDCSVSIWDITKQSAPVQKIQLKSPVMSLLQLRNGYIAAGTTTGINILKKSGERFLEFVERKTNLSISRLVESEELDIVHTLSSTQLGYWTLWQKKKENGFLFDNTLFNGLPFLLQLPSGLIVAGHRGKIVSMQFLRQRWRLLRLVFLARSEPRSPLFGLPDEVVFNVICLFFGRRELC